jgi:hypothetical protein
MKTEIRTTHGEPMMQGERKFVDTVDALTPA